MNGQAHLWSRHRFVHSSAPILPILPFLSICISRPEAGGGNETEAQGRQRLCSVLVVHSLLTREQRPPVKKGDSAEALTEDVVAACMGLAPPLEIPPDETLAYSRDFLRKSFCFQLQALLFELGSVPAMPARYTWRSVICGTPEKPSSSGSPRRVRPYVLHALAHGQRRPLVSLPPPKNPGRNPLVIRWRVYLRPRRIHDGRAV